MALVAALLVLILPPAFDIEGLSDAGERMLGIFLLAIVLWISEAIPLYATAAVIILAEILLVSDQAIVGTQLPDAPSYASFFGALSHPAIVLLLGGFSLALGASKFALDRNLARVLLRPFGTNPRAIVLGLMLITAVFSMFMSNAATTATLLAAVLPVVARLGPDDKLRTGIVLSIPVSANIGGIGTPVGTPPNAIAIGSLADAGIDISFVEWRVRAVPVMLVLLFGAWWLIMRLFPPSQSTLELQMDDDFDRSPSALILYGVFVVTILLWLTEPVHGVASSVVGFLPPVVLLATGVFGPRELQEMPWHVLWLVAGGIALGIGVTATGLDTWMVGGVSWEAMPTWAIVAVLAVVSLGLSTVISNSATANLILPLGLTLAVSSAVDLNPIEAGFFIAVAASLAMALPVSTPTNAIAYSTGAISTRDMVVTGAVIGVVGLVLYLVAAPVLWDLMGLSL